MVTTTEESELTRLENQVDNGGGGAWEYLCLVKKLKLRRFEKVAIAAMDCQSLDVAKECVTALKKKFPGSKRVGKLEALLLEAKGAWAEAEKAYSSLLEENPLDPVIHRRRIAMQKAQGNVSVAIEYLNKYLEIFMADHDAWRELAELYISLQMYKQAAFCYEELLLAQPMIPLYHLAYADVLYTSGGLENIQAAKKYYASTIDLTGGRNTRAIYGICLCKSAITNISKSRNKDEKKNELPSLAVIALEKDYKYRASDKLPLLTSALRSLNFSS